MNSELVVLVMTFFKIIRSRRMLLLRQILQSRKILNEKYRRRRRKLQKLFLVNQLLIPEMFSENSKPHFRSCYKKPRSEQYWNENVLKSATDSEYIEMFRMSKKTFEIICEKIKNIVEPSNNCVSTPVSVEKKVAITLYKLSSCSEYKVVGNLFGVHKSTVHKCFYQVVKAINTLRAEYISFPKLDEALEISLKFKESSKMENIIGSIDSTHIPILPPKSRYRDFVNKKGWPSLVLQAVVDHSYRFRDVSIQLPGSVHDATVFKESGIFKYAENIIPKYTNIINGIETPLMLVGDPSYPLLPWLLKPYVGTLSEEEESFNCYHSSSHSVVENAFGRLKARWRCLLKRMDIKYTFVPEVVLACCILHNIVEENKDPFVNMWMTFVEETERMLPQPSQFVSQQINNLDAKTIRDNLKCFMARSYPLRKS